MLPVSVNGRVQQNGQVIGHVRYINILVCLRGFHDKIFKFLLPLKSQKILGYKEIILKEK